MMEAKTLPPKYWAEAIKCAAYIQNRVPHKQLDGTTPFEAWSEHKPDVTHFRIFGSRHGLESRQRRGRLCSPKAKSVFLLDTLKIQKGTI